MYSPTARRQSTCALVSLSFMCCCALATRRGPSLGGLFLRLVTCFSTLTSRVFSHAALLRLLTPHLLHPLSTSLCAPASFPRSPLRDLGLVPPSRVSAPVCEWTCVLLHCAPSEHLRSPSPALALAAGADDEDEDEDEDDEAAAFLAAGALAFLPEHACVNSASVHTSTPLA